MKTTIQRRLTGENMRAVNLYYPSKLSLGAGCIREFQVHVSDLEVSRVFILTFPEILPVLEPFLSGLRQKGLELEVDDSIQKEPAVADFLRILPAAKKFAPDMVLGIGGGSVLDVAKLVAAQLHNHQALEEITGINLLSGRKTLLACMPTTSGTGSEVSPNSILLDEKEQLKKGIISPHLVPDMCYIDPELTLTVPPDVTAATGIDAFTHCLEAYVNRNSHPVIDTFALEGMKLIARSLHRAVREGGDLEARTDLSLGSLYGGMCLGPVNTTAIHALSYPLGSEFHVAHGLSNALLLPHVMEFNLPVAVERYARVAGILGIEDRGNPASMAEQGVLAVRELLAGCGIPETLSELGIGEDAIPRMAASALKVQRLLVNNPREVSLEDAAEIYSNAFKHRAL
jgi:alcohol dehydrogenase class IV